MPSVLIVDDDEAIRKSIADVLAYDDYELSTARDGVEAVRVFREKSPDLVLLDIKMPGMDGIEVLREIREQDAEVPVIILTGHGDFKTATEAGKLGAFDFMEKPPDFDVIRARTRNALENVRLRRENRSLRTQAAGARMLGESAAMQRVRETVARVAPTDARVLITGESGTGKELVARAIHVQSRRASGPLLKVNCAAIPSELIESELFGHEKGSFTGAHAQKKGKFEAAHKGTLFLDEVGDMPLEAQAKVLRVLQEGEVERVGGNAPIQVDVRVIAATNKNLVEEIEAGRFREDLYYRLNVVPIHLPPLRERGEDVLLLARTFLSEICAQHGLGEKEFAPDALERLAAHNWPGNVRELRNFVERAAILTPAMTITAADLPPLEPRATTGLAELIASIPTLAEFKEVAEKAYLEAKLEENGWNIARTAKQIDVQRSNIYKKLERYGLQNPANRVP